MENKGKNAGAPPCTIPAADADRLLAAADGGCALLYLYILRNGTAAGAERALRMRPEDLRAAEERLARLGLLTDDATPEPAEAPVSPPADEMPEYTAEDIVRRSGEDPGFRGLLAETERILGRTLSSADTRTLFGLYDHLGLPPEVLMLLLNHCVEEHRERYGAGRLPTMRSVEKEAYIWANREILTLDAAEEYLRARRARRDAAEQTRVALGIRDRALSPTERKYIESWLDMGFSPEAVAMAGDRTVTNTGQLRWAYANKIMLSWDGKGLHTPEEIEQGDRHAQGPVRTAAAPQPPSGGELDRLRKAYEKVRNG